MKKHLYEIKRLDIPAYLKWWFIKYRNAGTLSEVLENLTSPITLTNSLKRRFKIFEIGGNSVQDGEPSPTNEVAIQNVTGNVEVKVENKNLAINNEISNLLNYANTIYPNATGEKKKWIDNIINLPKDVNLIGNWDFTGDGKAVAGTSGERITIYYTDNTSQIITKGIKFIIPSGKTISYILIYGNQNATTAKWSNIQFEEGSATPYAPHEEQTAIFPLEEGMEMCKIGDYADSFVKQEGKWYKKKTIEKLVLNGSENWIYNGTSTTPTNRTVLLLYLTNIINTNYLSDYFIYGSTSSNKIALGKPNELYMSLEDSITGITSSDSISDKIQKIKDWLSNHNVTLYIITNPILEEITEQTLITQLDKIGKLYSYKGTTYISSTNDPSPLFTIQYVKEET